MSFLFVTLSNWERSSTQDDIVDGNEHELDDVADEADHDETHGACLQDFHVFYSQTKTTHTYKIICFILKEKESFPLK